MGHDPEKHRWKATKVLIEDKGSGTNLIQDLRNDGVFSIAIAPEGDKVVRMAAGSACIEDGRVFLPQKAPWLDNFRSEVLAFPNGAHDDQVDALSQLINWSRKRKTLVISEAVMQRARLETAVRQGYGQ
jgi:predicted phage terminase large subunit-like protein